MATKTSDALTIAYIAIGAHAAIRELQRGAQSDRALQAIIDREGGELGLVDRLIGHAPMLDALCPARFDGVFVYDVAEEFGAAAVRAMATEGRNLDDRCVTQIANDLIAPAQTSPHPRTPSGELGRAASSPGR